MDQRDAGAVLMGEAYARSAPAPACVRILWAASVSAVHGEERSFRPPWPVEPLPRMVAGPEPHEQEQHPKRSDRFQIRPERCRSATRLSTWPKQHEPEVADAKNERECITRLAQPSRLERESIADADASEIEERVDHEECLILTPRHS